MPRRLPRSFVLCLSTLAISIGAVGAGRATEPGAGSGAVPRWAEVPPLIPLDADSVVLEKVTVAARALAAGDIEVTSTYLLSNTTRRKARVRVAIPVAYEPEIAYLGSKVRVAEETTALVAARFGVPPTELDRSAFEVTSLDEASPVGQATSALALTIPLESYDATELTLVFRFPWGAVPTPRHFPGEKGFSLSLAALSDWPGDLQSVAISAIFEPPLLGPASFAEPFPYRYDSKGLHWEWAKPADAPLELPARVTLVVFDRYATTAFEGVYFARFEAEDPTYPWQRRFHHVRAVTTRPDGGRVMRRERVTEVLRELEEIELAILARNGKRFDDTFVQMRFQREPWYRPSAQFSEDRIRPVERWNLDYARCQSRAARTVLSAFEKTGVEEMPARGRRFRMLTAAFAGCDERFWSPTPRRAERPRLQ